MHVFELIQNKDYYRLYEEKWHTILKDSIRAGLVLDAYIVGGVAACLVDGTLKASIALDFFDIHDLFEFEKFGLRVCAVVQMYLGFQAAMIRYALLGVYGFEGVDAEPTVAEMSAADWKQQGLQRAAADVDVDKDSAVAKADVAAQNEFVVGLVAGPPGAVDTFAMVVGVVLQHFVG
eukprot:gene5754-biopygen171